jgi:hypothetical protein
MSFFPKYTIAVSILIFLSCKSGKHTDQSLSVGDYHDLGVPDPEQVWNVEDVMLAIDVFAGMKWERPYALPRKGSKKSGALFKRMIALENMTFLYNDTVSRHDKALMSLQFLHIFEKWKDVYTHPMWTNQYYHRELVEININEVRLTEAMVDLSKKVIASDEPAVTMLKAGVPQIKKNYISSIVNALNLQSHNSQFLEKDMLLLTDSLCSTLIRNRSWMDSSVTSGLRRSVELVLDSTASEDVRRKYDILLEGF